MKLNNIKHWFKYHTIFGSGWNEYHNPYYYWWKARKYFKRPKAHLVKGEYSGYFGLPCRTDFYHKGLNFFMRGLGWKSKWNESRHEWDPIICIVWVNPWKTWTPNEFSKETNIKGEKGFYQNKQYWFGWIFNWVKKDADYNDDSYVSSLSTWEAILDYLYFGESLEKCIEYHQAMSGIGEDSYYITIKDNIIIKDSKFKYTIYPTGIDILDSYKVFWDKNTINNIYRNSYGFRRFTRSKFSLYLEWFIHSLCYKIGYQKNRAKNVFLEFDKSWFRNLFKR